MRTFLINHTASETEAHSPSHTSHTVLSVLSSLCMLAVGIGLIFSICPPLGFALISCAIIGLALTALCAEKNRSTWYATQRETKIVQRQVPQTDHDYLPPDEIDTQSIQTRVKNNDPRVIKPRCTVLTPEEKQAEKSILESIHYLQDSLYQKNDHDSHQAETDLKNNIQRYTGEAITKYDSTEDLIILAYQCLHESTIIEHKKHNQTTEASWLQHAQLLADHKSSVVIGKRSEHMRKHCVPDPRDIGHYPEVLYSRCDLETPKPHHLYPNIGKRRSIHMKNLYPTSKRYEPKSKNTHQKKQVRFAEEGHTRWIYIPQNTTRDTQLNYVENPLKRETDQTIDKYTHLDYQARQCHQLIIRQRKIMRRVSLDLASLSERLQSANHQEVIDEIYGYLVTTVDVFIDNLKAHTETIQNTKTYLKTAGTAEREMLKVLLLESKEEVAMLKYRTLDTVKKMPGTAYIEKAIIKAYAYTYQAHY